MARAKRQTAKRAIKGKGKNPLDPLSLYYAASTAQQLGQYMPSQRTVNRIVGSLNPRNPEGALFPSTGHLEFTPDGIERFIRGGYVYRAFSNTPVFEDGYRVGAVEGYATEMVPGYAVNPTKFEQRNSRRGRRNPADSSDELYEKFHGVPPNETLSIHEDEHVHGHLAGLGDLVEIVVCLTGGSKAGGTTTLIAPNPNSASDKRIVRVASNEAANQMYLVGGDQKVDVQKLGFRDSFDVTHDGETFEATELKDLMVLGEVQKLTYQTRKAADGFKLIDYYHQLGEDTLVRPFLLYDTMNEKMRIAGGQYHIHGVGVVN